MIIFYIYSSDVYPSRTAGKQLFAPVKVDGRVLFNVRGILIGLGNALSLFPEECCLPAG